MKLLRGVSVISLGAICCCGCSSKHGAQSPFVGTWQYDRQSLRDEALHSAIESVSGGDPGSLSADEVAEVEAWVDENHAGWDKSIVIEDDGRFSLTSRVGEGSAEVIEGYWERAGAAIRLLRDDGELVAEARVSGITLNLVPPEINSEYVPGSGVMVMDRVE